MVFNVLLRVPGSPKGTKGKTRALGWEDLKLLPHADDIEKT